MADTTMLDAVKLSLAVTVDDYDSEIMDLIDAALADMRTRGILVDELVDAGDALLLQAVKTYARANFQSPADHDRLVASWENQIVTMMHASGYTNFETEVG